MNYKKRIVLTVDQTLTEEQCHAMLEAEGVIDAFGNLTVELDMSRDLSTGVVEISFDVEVPA